MLVDVKRNGAQVFDALLKLGVIVRPVGGGYGMPNHIRVSIGLQEENSRFLDTLEQVLSQIPVSAEAL